MSRRGQLRALVLDRIPVEFVAECERAVVAIEGLLDDDELVSVVSPATVDGSLGLLAVTDQACLFAPANGTGAFRFPGPNLEVAEVDGTSDDLIGLQVTASDDAVLLQDVGGKAAASAVAAAISAMQGRDLAPPRVVFSDDPTAVLRCPGCGAEFTAAFTGSRCGECNQPLVNRAGNWATPAMLDEPGADDWGDDDADIVLEPFATPNPFLRRLFGLKGYGDVPAKASALLRDVSPDPDEVLLAALHTNHGKYKRGYLLLTTNLLRWVQTFPFRDNNYWSLDYVIEVDGAPLSGGIIRTSDGNQFQVRWGKAKSFGEMYRLAQQALAWDMEHGGVDVANDDERVPETPEIESGSGLVFSLERLAELHASGVLTSEEFAAAKRKLLS